MLSRRAWVQASLFHGGTNAEVMDRLVDRFPRNSVAILDLDQTLYRNAPRTVAVLKTILPHLRDQLSPAVCALIEDLEETRMGFSIRDTFRMNGLMPDEGDHVPMIACLRKGWWPLFFSDRYLPHDVPYEGAAEFCRRLADAGAKLVYLSARDGRQMRKGTEANLSRDGFPQGVVLLRETDEGTDGEFKVGAAGEAEKHGNVTLCLENEPGNVALLKRRLPDTAHVFVDTLCSEAPTVPCIGLDRITGYR